MPYIDIYLLEKIFVEGKIGADTKMVVLASR
jgi:hypothetical protein